MGHLINPIGYRLGRGKQKFVLEPNQLKKTVNFAADIDNYLKTAFSKYVVRRTGVIYSHFNIFSTIHEILLNVFFYAPDFVVLQKRKFIKYISRTSFFVDKFKLAEGLKYDPFRYLLLPKKNTIKNYVRQWKLKLKKQDFLTHKLLAKRKDMFAKSVIAKYNIFAAMLSEKGSDGNDC